MSENVNVGRVFNLTTGGGDMSASIYDPTGQATDIYAYARGLVESLGSGDMEASVYDPNGMQTDVFAYARNLVTAVMNEFFDNLISEQAIYRSLCDDSGESIQDSEGNDILARLIISIR